MAINRLLTDRVLQKLEALALACRIRVPSPERPPAPEEGLHIWSPYLAPGTTPDWHRPTPGRADCPICRELPQPGPIEDIRASMRQILDEPARGTNPSPQDEFGPRATPAEMGEVWIPGVESLASRYPAGERPPAVSYTRGQNGALEEIRRAGERSNEGLAAGYRPVERPTSPCSACPALVDPANLWVGKRSGIVLCDPCMTKWEKGGRAKRTGEF